MRKAEERRRRWETEEMTSEGERGWRRFQRTLKFGFLLLIDKRTCGYRGTQEFAWLSTIIRTMTGLKTSNTCPGSFPCPTLSTELPHSFRGNCPKKGGYETGYAHLQFKRCAGGNKMMASGGQPGLHSECLSQSNVARVHSSVASVCLVYTRPCIQAVAIQTLRQEQGLV